MGRSKIDYAEVPGKGRGVFATAAIGPGEVIERVPVIVIPPEQEAHLVATVLDSYYFKWGDQGECSAIALGLGSMYNHSNDPVAYYRKRIAEGEIEFIALRSIQPGEEITINYNGVPHDQTEIVFEGSKWWSVG